MRERRRKFTPEFKDEAVKMVIESSRPVAEVAREIQVNEGTLGNWVNKYRVDHAGEEPPLSISDRSRLRELERENRELKIDRGLSGFVMSWARRSSASWRRMMSDPPSHTNRHSQPSQQAPAPDGRCHVVHVSRSAYL